MSHKLVLLLIIGTYCDGARILMVIPTPSYSHHIIFQPIWKELALRGHDVVVLTTHPLRDPTIPNLKEIDLSFAYNIWNNGMKQVANNALFTNLIGLVDLIYRIVEDELNHSEVHTLLNNKSEHFDLVMVEFIHPIMCAFKYKFKAPLIGVASMEILGYAHELFGNPNHRVLYPEVIFGLSEELSLWDRMFSLFGSNLIETIWKIAYAARDDALIEKYFGEGYPAVTDLIASADMLFINANPVFYNVRPVSPATIMISGGIHIKESKPLPKDLQTFFNKSINGVIYFSLGSNIESKNIPDQTRNTIIKVLSELPYDVLWKYEDDNLPGKPKNVKTTKWAPQQDVLRHPKTKLFITQAGIQSLEEALFSHVPIVAIPFCSDQNFNAKKVLNRGMGLIIEDHKLMTADDLKYKILEVINNPKYKNRIKEFAGLVRDEPMTALEKAVWWTEYVLRHGGAQHLKSKNIPFHQFYYLDVMAVLGAVFMFIYFVVKSICKCCKRAFKTKVE